MTADSARGGELHEGRGSAFYQAARMATRWGHDALAKALDQLANDEKMLAARTAPAAPDPRMALLEEIARLAKETRERQRGAVLDHTLVLSADRAEAALDAALAEWRQRGA